MAGDDDDRADNGYWYLRTILTAWAVSRLQALPWQYFPWLVGTLLAYCCVAQGMKVFYIRRFKQWY
nr:magnesium-translocating P-type ATPase [Raoultella sp. NCTC 9187]